MYPSTCNYTDFTEPLTIWQDNQAGAVRFYGQDNAVTVPTAPATVAESAYDISGNGGRKITRLSNGWFVIAARDTGISQIKLYVSKDNFTTQPQYLAYITGTTINADAGFSICSYGTNVYVLGCQSTGSANRVIRFDAGTIPLGSEANNYVNVDSGQNSFGSGCSLAVDSNGKLWAAWSSRNSSYPHSFNIRVSSSTDGVNWATPTQVSTAYLGGYDRITPCLVVRSINQPIVFCVQTYSGNANAVMYSSFNGNSWVGNDGGFNVIYHGGTYTQINPSADVSPDGTIHVTWVGMDSTDTSVYNVAYSKSTDGGATWSPRVKLTSGNTYQHMASSVTTDKNNNVHVIWTGKDAGSTSVYQVKKIVYSSGSWSSIANLTAATNQQYYPQTCNNYRDFIDPIMIWQDNQTPSIKFRGVWREYADLSFTQGGLQSNTKYPVTMEVKDSTGNTTTYTKDAYTKADTSTVAAITLSPASVKLTVTDKNPDYTQYQITCGTKYVSQAGTLTNTPFWILLKNKTITVTGLSPDTNYTFKIKAHNSEGIETESSTATSEKVPMPLPVPTGLKAVSIRDNVINVTWGPVEGATGYDIEVDGNTTSTGTNLYYEHKNLQPNTQHTYRIRAKKDAATSEWSPIITKKTLQSLPGVPQNVVTTASGISISISWGALSEAAGYEIEVDGQVISTEFKTGFTHTGLKPKTQHTYRIRAKNEAGFGRWSNLYTCTTTDGIPVTAPTFDINSIDQKKTSTSITLIWNPVIDAEYYEIRDITNSMDSKPVSNGAATCCEIKGLEPKKEYKFQVRARSSMDDGDTTWSAEIPITTFLLDIPVNITANESDTSIKFTWDNVKGAESYSVQINEIPLVGDPILVELKSGINEPLYTKSDLKPEKQYKFSIMAENSMGKSGWSEPVAAKTLPTKPGVPQNVSAVVTDTIITIRWDDVSAAEPNSTTIDGYDIEIDGVLLENDIDTSYIYDELIPNTVYKYRVRARNSDVEGDWSEVQAIKTLPGVPKAPDGINVKSTKTGATITWNPEAGATGYDVEISQLQGDNDDKVIIETIKNITKTSYTHRKLNPLQKYRYRILTRNVQGISNYSGYVINNAIKAKCKKNNSVDLGLTATDVVDFSSYTMVVTYNPGVIDVTDLCTLSGKAELAAGKIEGTDITIREYVPGRIVFVVDKAVTPGEAWTGVINSIKFKAKVTGGTTITYTVYTKPEEGTP